ncbi:MAG: hypothetical protein CMH32_01275 [Micavibrio sp.]|nr:hypothetical protein [Micavibrio sp.]HCK31965.1 hypothetical protein [Rhodospirillaceae bacterium]|tara:strand:- start:1617 stop:2525 length:909 start_codon:yes stop_codon:yes gene_type:complete
MKNLFKTYFAIFAILIGDLCIVLMGAFSKDLSDIYSALEIAFIRNFVAFLAITAWIIGTRQYHLMRTTRLKGQILRAAIGNMDIVLVFWAYALIPLAMVTTILFVVPILTLAMSILFLKEKAGIFRWSAVIAGFIAMLVISYPALNGSGEQSISMLGVTVAFIAATGAAFVQILLRSMGKEGEPPLTTIFYFLGLGSVFLGIPVLLNGLSVSTIVIGSIIGLCLTGLGNQVFKTIAYQKAEASLLAPFRYVALIWAALVGYIVWQEIPNTETLIGAFIIVAANAVLIIRERMDKKISEKEIL